MFTKETNKHFRHIYCGKHKNLIINRILMDIIKISWKKSTEIKVTPTNLFLLLLL